MKKEDRQIQEMENTRLKYSSALDTHNSEGQIQWTRYSAMLIINTALIALIGFAYGKDSPRLAKLIFLFVPPIFGLIICGYWMGMSKRGFYWTRHWLNMARDLENDLFGGTNPVNEGYKIYKSLSEKGITEKNALRIIEGFRVIYILILVINVLILLFNLVQYFLMFIIFNS